MPQKNALSILILLLVLSSCGARKKASQASESSSNPEKTIEDQIVATAISYNGTAYRFGGTTTKGMDCSGLVYTSFLAHGKSLPRVSYQMAREGKKIKLQDVQKGDLLFFKTNKRGRNRINHVGLVVSEAGEPVQFIHATTSRGVLISKLAEPYWNKAFVEVRTIL